MSLVFLSPQNAPGKTSLVFLSPKNARGKTHVTAKSLWVVTCDRTKTRGRTLGYCLASLRDASSRRYPCRMKCQRRWRGKGWKTSGWMRSGSSRSSDGRLAPRAARSMASAASEPARLM